MKGVVVGLYFRRPGSENLRSWSSVNGVRSVGLVCTRVTRHHKWCTARVCSVVQALRCVMLSKLGAAQATCDHRRAAMERMET